MPDAEWPGRTQSRFFFVLLVSFSDVGDRCVWHVTCPLNSIVPDPIMGTAWKAPIAN